MHITDGTASAAPRIAPAESFAAERLCEPPPRHAGLSFAVTYFVAIWPALIAALAIGAAVQVRSQ